MSFAFIENGSVTQYPIGFGEIKRRFPNTLFALPLEGQDLSDFGAYEVQPTEQPSINVLTQELQEATPAWVDGAWKQVWTIVELSSEDQQAITDSRAHSIRAERDKKLTDTDWTQIPNNALSDESKTAWATYRQSLRDITADSGFPHSITWPDQPGS